MLSELPHNTPTPEKVDILIVDDLPEKLLVLQAVLQDPGQNVVLARSGAEALREILKREFAVILLDVNMPDIDGMEAAGLIRQYRKSAHTPIIFITAYADELQTLRGYALGAVDYIFSPVIPEVLRSKVRVFVELHRMQHRIREQAEERIALAQAEAARQAAEESTRRLNFLERASHELGGSLDRSHGANRLLELLVPGIAPLAVLVLTEGPDSGGVAVYRAVGDRSGGAAIDQGCSIPPALSGPLAAAMERDCVSPLHADALTPDDRAEPGWPGGLRSGMILPLHIGGRCLGALVLARESGDAVDPRDVAVLELLASRSATAFVNSRLYSNLQQEIVERQEAEYKLEDASRRKDEFLAMLAHELRNPLAPIRNAVELLRRIGPRDHALAEARDIIERQVTHLTRLVEELLDVARIAQGKVSLRVEQIQLATVVEDAVETARPLIEGRRHLLTLKLPDAPLWLCGDSTRLAQVIANLLNNAAKYTPEGGRIELAAGLTGEEVFIAVRDNGVGLEPELLARVFDLFTQGARTLDRSQGGLGVGLTLVRQLVQLHGGRVEGYSRGPGQGAEFVIYLPAQLRVPVRATPALHAAAANTRMRRVLVVDDNQDAAESMAAMLHLEGHRVILANDGVQALVRAREFSPEIVLLDLGLPKVSGYEIAQQLQSDPQMRGIMLIALTGYGQPEDVARTAASGFHRHFVKPVEPQRILDAIAEWS